MVIKNKTSFFKLFFLFALHAFIHKTLNTHERFYADLEAAYDQLTSSNFLEDSVIPSSWTECIRDALHEIWR